MNMLPLSIAGALTFPEANHDEAIRRMKAQNPPRPIDPQSSQAATIAVERMNRALSQLAAAGESERHDMLLTKASYLFGMIAGGWPLDAQTLERELIRAMAQNGALAKYGEHEIGRCIRDARAAAPVIPVEIQERQESKYDDPTPDLDRAPDDTPQDWPTQHPDGWREAENEALDKYGFIIEAHFQAVAAGLINPNNFTAGELHAAAQSLQIDIPQTTLYRVLVALSGELFPFFHSIESAQDLIGNFGNNSTRGRKTVHYCRNPYGEVKAELIKRLTLRVYEDASDSYEGEVLMPPTAGTVQAAGIEEAGAAAVATDLHKALAPAYRAQGNKELAAVKRANSRRARLIQNLDNPHSTPLSKDIPLNSAANYRAAYARGIVEANPNIQMSNSELADKTGYDARSVKALRYRAGIQAESKETEVQVQSFDDVRAYGKKHRAYAHSFVARTDKGQIETPAANESYSVFITRQRAIGATVTAHFRHTSTYVAKEAPAPAERKPRERVEGLQSRPVERTSEPKPERYYGPGYDPRWVMKQLQLALKLLGWQRAGEGLVNPDTGEYAPDTPVEIIEILIGREIVETWEGFSDLAAELGAECQLVEMSS